MVVQPPYSTAYCITETPFDSKGMPESYVILRHVQSITLEEAFQEDGRLLAQTFDPQNGKTIVLIYGYGVVAVGRELLKTYIQIEVLESMCGVTLQALRRGPVSLLEPSQVDELDQVFCGGH